MHKKGDKILAGDKKRKRTSCCFECIEPFSGCVSLSNVQFPNAVKFELDWNVGVVKRPLGIGQVVVDLQVHIASHRPGKK